MYSVQTVPFMNLHVPTCIIVQVEILHVPIPEFMETGCHSAMFLSPNGEL